MIAWVIFGGASVAFWLGVRADAASSAGPDFREKTRFFRNRDGTFNRRRYLLTMGGLYVALLVIPMVGQDTLLTVSAAAMLVAGAVLRFRQAAKNWKIRKAAGM